MHGNVEKKMIEFPFERGTASAYEARPGGAGSYPAIIVIQEWWGLTAHIKDVAERLAHEGFVALAPDLYQGKTTTDPALAAAWKHDLDPDEVIRTLQGAVRFLQEKEPIYAEHIGVFGFCLGGAYSLLLACRSRDIRAAAAFYGEPPDPIDQVRNIQCPVLFAAGGMDQRIDAGMVGRLQEAFEKHGVQGEVRVYPEAGHAFFNDTRPEFYDPAAAQDAWMRAVGLFSRILKS